MALNTEKMKILALDIETPPVEDAAYGFVMAVSTSWMTRDGVTAPVTKVLPDFKSFKKSIRDDREILEYVSKLWGEATHVMAHYGGNRRFDWPFLTTRLLINRMKPLPEVKFIDTWKIARDRLYMRSRSLRKLISTFGTPTEKPEVHPTVWMDAIQGNKAAYEVLRDRCGADVKSMVEVAHLLLPLIAETAPSVHLCDPKHLRSNGFRVADKQRYRRLVCMKCHTYLKGPVVPFGEEKA